jgi:hypothetical protein
VGINELSASELDLPLHPASVSTEEVILPANRPQQFFRLDPE